MVPIKMDGYRLVIANTNKKRSLGEGKYNERRSECDKGLAYLKKAFPKAEYLREISEYYVTEQQQSGTKILVLV